MKKLIILFLFFCTSVQSQTTWFSLNPETSTRLNSVYFVNSNTGFIGGDSNKILKTTNGGLNWTTKIVGQSNILINFHCIEFINENTGFASGGKDFANFGYVLKTTNGGENWFNDNRISLLALKGICFTSSVTGYVAGIGCIYKTVNGGNTWSSQFSNFDKFFLDVDFIDSNTGVAVGYNNGLGGIIYKTTDGGQNWNSISPLPYIHFTSIQFVSNSVAYVSCLGGKLLKTTDTGDTWTLYPVLGTSEAFNSLYFTSINSGFEVGQGSSIVKTTNGGSNFEANLSPSINELMSVFFINTNTGYAVGLGGTILKTTNGGNLLTGININLKILFEGLYNSFFNQLIRKDTLTLFLRDNISPFALKDSVKSVIDSVSTSGLFSFPNANTGSYYIVAKHFNSIETWSKLGGDSLVNDGNIYDYDFTNSNSQAYGNNLKLIGGRYCVYSGDVDQNGYITLADILYIYNKSQIFETGSFLPSDLNGDSIVDLADINLCYNNSINFVRVLNP